MPGTDGLAVCRELRSVSDIPIILLTAKDSELDYVMGIGAADKRRLIKVCEVVVVGQGVADFVQLFPQRRVSLEDGVALLFHRLDLTDAEKETLLADIKELNGLDAEMEALYAQLPDCDDLPLYEKALEKADPKVLDEIDTLEQEYDRVCEKHADLWDKVDEAYFDLPDYYDFDNYDEAAFIRSLSFLTDAEKFVKS